MPPGIVQRWVDRVVAADVDGLLALYHPDAVLDAPPDLMHGRDEIAERLRLLGRKMRGMNIRVLREAAPKGGLLTFETEVRGRLGEARLAHAWVLEGDRIRRHGITVCPDSV